MSLTPGLRLGPYEVSGSLGAGGMGEVYRARDTKLARDVALKVLPELFADDPDRLARFTREAQALAALNHPNIAQIYGVEESGRVRALVMELVDGQTLQELIDGAKATGLPLSDALPIARQIADALEAAHEHGIVHRDLKPANIKVRFDGAVKVLDFGLAKALAPDGATVDAMQSPTVTARATQMGVILGTAAYMAPEQAKGKAVDRRADIWAFGVILHEMLTGQRLFDAETIQETLAHVLTREIDLGALPPTTPPHVRSLIARCLVKDPRQRLRDIGEARLVLGGDPAAGAGASGIGGGDGAPVRLTGLRWREAGGWALAALLALVGGYAAWSRPALPAAAPALRLSIPLDAVVSLGGLSIAVAPDGHALAIQAPWNSGDTRLQIRRLDGTSVEPLPGTESGRTPFWSPDSRAIAFVADGQLKRYDFQASSARRLCAAPQLGVGGAWGTDGSILFAGPAGAISRVSAAGGSVTTGTLDTAVGETTQARPVFLPDGNRFLYVSRRSDGSVRTMIGRLDSGARAELASEELRVAWAGPDWLVYLRGDALYAQAVDYDTPALAGDPALIATDLDSSAWAGVRVTAADTGLVAYVGRADRRRQFTWYSRTGGNGEPIGPRGEYMTFDLSPDGRRVVAELRAGSASNLWTMDAAKGTTAPLTVGDVGDVDPRWSPDGRSVLFGSLRDPARSPFRVTPGGDPPTLAWKFDGRQFSLDHWSKDGRWVLHHETNVPVLQARLIDPVTRPGEKPAEVVIVARALAGTIDQAQMSPDGRWVAYNSNESGRYEVLVVPFPPTGEQTQVSRNGGVQPRWRADGGELYFLALDGTLMSVRRAGGTSLAFGQPTALFKPNVLTPTPQIEQYAPNADGTRFLVLDFAGEARAPAVQVVSNWRALIDRQPR